MANIPTEFLDKCDADQRQQVLSWWDSLNAPNQNEIRVLLDRRHDCVAHVYGLNKSGEFDWYKLPIVDDELPSDDADENEWQINYFQHLLDHPELMADETYVIRYHIGCFVHESAQQAIAVGKLDNKFTCSNRDPQCPFAHFIDGYQSARLLKDARQAGYGLWLCRR